MENKTTGQILVELRRRLNLSQEEVADRVGIARGTLAGYESDSRNPKYSSLQKLSDFYGVSIEYILGKDDPPEGEDISADKRILLQSIKGMTDDEARQARAINEALRKTAYGE